MFSGWQGQFVADTNHELVREEQLKEIEGLLEKAVEKSKISGVELDELTEMLKMLYEEE